MHPAIIEIDRQIAKVSEQRQPFIKAIERAKSIAIGEQSMTDDTAVTNSRRSAITSWLLGIGDRAAVDQAERQAEQRAAAAAAVERERRLAELGEEALRAELAPLDSQIGELSRQRAAVVAQALQAEVEAEAVAYREALVAAGRRLARLRAFAAIAEQHGAGRVLAGDGVISAPAPVRIGGFDHDFGRQQVAVQDGRPDGPWQLTASAAQARAQVADELRSKGLI